MKACLALTLGCIVTNPDVLAQSSSQPPGIGASGGLAVPNLQASRGNDVLRHRDFTGKPCLVIGGYARPHTVDRNLYDHVISVRNNCPQRIALQVCYYRTQDCVSIEVSGADRKETILGTLPSQKDFPFEFREKF
jgi:hypothetical protein